MKKRIVTMLLASMMLLSSTVAYAQDISGVSGTSTSAQVSSSFTVASAELPNDLSQIVISVPANLDLTLNEEETFYTKDAVVSAKGTLRDGYELAISTGSTATYSASEHPNVTGAVTFGTQKWSAAQLEASKTTLDSRDINIKVDANDVTESATYSANIDFNISVEAVNYTNTTFTGADIAKTNCLSGGVLTIPATYEYGGVNYKVTAIADSAFNGNEDITSVVIPNTVTSIGNYAFNNCYNLASVTIPSSVTSIGDFAFFLCSISNLTIPEGVTSIGESAFDGNNISTLSLPNTLTSIESAAFQEAKISSLTIPGSVTEVDGFINCSNLSEVTISSGTTKIASGAFQGSAIETLNLPNTITNIGDMAFQGASIRTINYSGTKAYFRGITGLSCLVDYNSDMGSTGTITVHCSDGDITYNDGEEI